MSNYTKKTIKGVDAISDYSEMSEMSVYVGSTKYRTFLQRGFFEYTASSSNLHNHKYNEIHVVKCGNVDMIINGERINVPEGSAIIIPVGQYHTRKSDAPEECIICAFQVDMDVKRPRVENLEGITEMFFDEIDLYNKTGESRKLSSLLALVCSAFCDESSRLPIPIYDREFIIYEFFANNYDKDVTLADIAVQLRVSEKQAERLIIKSTGMSFRRQIVAKRIENAKMLVKTEGISLAKAAEMVGYQSYSGFWKALQSYEAETEADLDIHPALKEKNIDK